MAVGDNTPDTWPSLTIDFAYQVVTCFARLSMKFRTAAGVVAMVCLSIELALFHVLSPERLKDF